jgi:hypothetical protein
MVITEFDAGDAARMEEAAVCEREFAKSRNPLVRRLDARGLPLPPACLENDP